MEKVSSIVSSSSSCSDCTTLCDSCIKYSCKLPHEYNCNEDDSCLTRETFAFDRVLYADECVEVTPSAITALSTNQTIDLDDVACVRTLLDSRTPLMKPRWWQRVAPSRRIRARAPKAPLQANLLLEVAPMDADYFTMALRVEEPHAVKLAIADARCITY